MQSSNKELYGITLSIVAILGAFMIFIFCVVSCTPSIQEKQLKCFKECKTSNISDDVCRDICNLPEYKNN